jgi:cell division inhibitor SepF
MSFVDKFKDLVGIEDFDEEEITEEEIREAQSRMEKREAQPRTSFEPRRSEIKESKVVNMQKGTTVNTHPFKMVVLEPKGFEEAPKLVDNLKSRKPVIVNLERLESDTARKIFDFLSGATYALNGNVQKVANNIFVFAPENVDINSSVDHKGFEFGSQMKR